MRAGVYIFYIKNICQPLPPPPFLNNNVQEQISNPILTILFSPILHFLSTLTPFIIFVQNVKYRLLG